MTDGHDKRATLEVAQERSRNRSAAFIEALPPDIDAADDRIEGELARQNAAPRSKLVKILRLADAAMAYSAPYVACAKGCSACCKMNVTISSIEADRLAAASGRRAATLNRPIVHDLAEFNGVPCPFLVGDVCSVYEVRPFACRTHMSFDTDSYWCQPERALLAAMQQFRPEGAITAYRTLVAGSRLGGTADIRDFFPAK